MNKSFFASLCIFYFLLVTNISFAQDSAMTIPLWKNGAPGFENKKDLHEEAQDWWVRNIHNPSLVVYPAPTNIATGIAIVVCPGGGFNNLVFNAEGRDPAAYLNSLGITAFVLKYRLFRRDSALYTEENPKQDIFRAMRLVRSRAKEFNIDTARIGVMGFSAGGEVAGWVGYHFRGRARTETRCHRCADCQARIPGAYLSRSAGCSQYCCQQCTSYVSARSE